MICPNCKETVMCVRDRRGSTIHLNPKAITTYAQDDDLLWHKELRFVRHECNNRKHEENAEVIKEDHNERPVPDHIIKNLIVDPDSFWKNVIEFCPLTDSWKWK